MNGTIRAAHLTLIAICVIALVSRGQSQSHPKDDLARFDVTIPFEFVVGNHAMPAGPYRFEQLLGSTTELDVLSVRCLETRAYQAITTSLVTSADPQIVSRLVFHRYGNRSFLAGLWVRGKRIGLQLHASAMENQVAQAQLAREDISLVLNGEAALASARAASNH